MSSDKMGRRTTEIEDFYAWDHRLPENLTSPLPVFHHTRMRTLSKNVTYYFRNDNIDIFTVIEYTFAHRGLSNGIRPYLCDENRVIGKNLSVDSVRIIKASSY